MTWSEIADLFVTIEFRLIASLKRNLKAHKAWEKDEGFEWPAWQAEKLRNLERFRRENQSIAKEYSEAIDEETALLMKEQFAEGQKEVSRQVQAAQSWSGRSPGRWNQRGNRRTAMRWNHNVELPKEDAQPSFFGLNEPRLEKLIEDIQNKEKNAISAALRTMDDVYRKTILNAEIAMSTGATTLPQAIDIAVKGFLEKGITCIQYRNGRMVNIADYAQMALRTAATRSFLQGEAKRRDALGIDTVLVSQYGQCSETCLPWQGRVYIDDVWGGWDGERRGNEGKSNNGKWYPLLSVAIEHGLFHPNCRHTVSAWIEGISTLPKPMDGDAIRKNAKLEQQQRKLEGAVRRCKRLAEGTSEPEKSKEYRARVRQAQKALRDFIAEHNDVLRRDYWREKTYGVPV